jgi:hypothetical protein
MRSVDILLAETPHSAPVTHVADTVGWTIGLIVIVGVIYWLMRQGWQWRKTQQSGLPALPAVPKHTTEPILELEGRYLATTSAGQWLDRIVAHNLGLRSLAELTLTAEGLTVVRPASTDNRIAGKVVPEGGLLVVTWEHGGKQLDSGFRADHPAEHENWVTAIEVLMRAHAKVTAEKAETAENVENREGA